MSFGLDPVSIHPCMVDHLTDGQALRDALAPLDEIARHRSDWHATAVGLQTIEALVRHLTSGQPPQLDKSAQAHVLWDLQSLRSCLTEARSAEKNSRFRLEAG